MVYWEILEAGFEVGTVVDITRLTFDNQRLFNLWACVAPTSLGETDSCQH